MSQYMPPDPEVGGGPGRPAVDGRRNNPMMTPNQQLHGESNIGDSSGLLFSIYSKAAEDEDNKMVERWQKDAEGILFFTGLFSAAVAALLAVTVLDLRPNSQDISAFYLGIIYQVLADPNGTQTSTPFFVAKPPSFSPPRYSVCVNSFWFLSLVMSLSCALWATSLQQWARRYLHRAQPARCSPEKRARMRAFFAGGVDKMHITWAVEGLPMLLHLSLFLFFGGVGIFLFNVDREVFSYVIFWIGLFSLVYGLITLLPIIRHDSPYHSPLSTPAWFLYAGIHHVTFKILAFITLGSFWSLRIWESCEDLKDRYHGWILGGVEKAAEETASERTSEIDVQILDWTVSALGDDDSLKNFFETIPRSFSSKMLEHLKSDIPSTLRDKILLAVRGFCERTLSSNSISDSEKVHRLDISNNAINQISGRTRHWLIYFLSDRLGVPQTVEMGHTLARWFTNNGQDIPMAAQRIMIAEILVNVRERNDSWVALAARLFGLPERDLRDKIALGDDSVLLDIFIHVTREYLRSGYPDWGAFHALSKLDIRHTLPRLQHDFCTLWNEMVREAKNEGLFNDPLYILKKIRHAYIALHQGTDAAPTAFSASTDDLDLILFEPSSYPFCNLAHYRLDSTARVSPPLPTQPDNSSDPLSPSPTTGGKHPSRQAEQANNVTKPPSSSNSTATGESGAASHGSDITPPTSLVRSISRPTSALPTVVVTSASRDITATSRPLEGSEQQDSDIVAQSTEPGTSQISSTASTYAPPPTPILIPTSLPNTPSKSYHAGVASVSNPLHLATPSIDSSIIVSRPTRAGSATPPRLRARGLVNTGNMCFANAVLQLLVISPPFWNLFKELGDLKAQRRAGFPETGGGATPLVDAAVRFFKEFTVEEKSPFMQQQSQPTTGRTSRVDEEKKEDSVVNSFEPTYLYDAMKEKRQLKPLLDGQQHDAEDFFGLYLDALDEELPALLASISGRHSASAVLEAEEQEVYQSGQTEANLVESPTTRIFGGKFRSLIRAPNQPNPVPTEDWRSLHLDIQPDSVRTVEDALMRVSQSQSMQDGPSGLSDASQQILIEALPPVLVLHLKRFRCDAAAAGRKTKIGKSIRFEPDLEIPLDIMVPNPQRPSGPPHYKLYGVLYHHGDSVGSGHYTVDVLQPNGDEDTGEVWLHIDDEAVIRVGHEDVFGDGGHCIERAANERCAYLLFYCRTSPIGTS